MDLCVEIGKCGAKCVIKTPDAVFVRRGVWLWGMVNEVVSEEILEDIEVPTACTSSVLRQTIAFAASVDISS
jgi:hypothetical protein